VNASFGRPIQGKDVFRIFAVMLALDVVVAFVVLPLIGDDSPAQRNNADIAESAFTSATALVAIWLVMLRRPGASLADLGYVPSTARWIRLACAMGMGWLILEAAVYGEIEEVLRISSSVWWQMPGAPHTSVLEGITTLAYSAAIVPVAEELVFRGVLFRWARQRFSFWPAALVSAVPFGLVHYWLNSIIAAALIAFALCWLYERSGSLMPAIAMHGSFNVATTSVALGVEWFEISGF
jgi:membrane protease YdiL (CAAX protease family)